MSIQILDAQVQWRDGYMNEPDLCFLVDRAPEWTVYDKRPCMEEMGSADQTAIIGSRFRRNREGWHLYWAEDDGFAWFFTWGGRPDDGFGGWRRTIHLVDGGSEEIVGGWHTSPDAASDVGHPAVVDCAYRTDYFEIRGEKQLSGGSTCFLTHQRFREAVAEHLLDCEVIDGCYNSLTVKWRGQLSKEEFMAIEHERLTVIRESLKVKYHDGSWHGGHWIEHCTEEEREALHWRPYSALGLGATV